MIVVENLKKVYENGALSLEVLKGINLKVESEEYVALMGPSGSGKSTFMNILGCLDQLTDGKYYLDNIDIATMTQDELSTIRNQKLGFIFQSFNLLPKLSSLENVILPAMYAGMPKKERYERGVEALTAVGLGDRVHHKPNELSGGQRQRVAVARALVNKPSIILADEPTGNLDTKTSIEIMTLFEEIYKKGNTIILVTHEEDIALYARRIVRLRDGLIESDEINKNVTMDLS